MGKVKVCYLVEDLKRGGMENIVACLARGMDKEKYDVAVWCVVGGGEVADELSAAGITVKVLRINGYYNPINILRLALLFRKESFDILHMQGYFSATIGRIASLLAGIPFRICHVHTIFYNMNRRNMLIDQFLNRFTQKVIFISKAVLDSFVNAGYSFGNKAVIILNGTPDCGYTLRDLRMDTPVLINVASLYAHKGQKYLIMAMKEVLTEFPQAVLWLVGDGPLRGELERQANELRLGLHVKFWGRRQDIAQLLSQAHIFILPSLREGVPLSIIEAMSSGLPVLATRVGGVPEMVAENASGILCQPSDSQALAEGIMALCRNAERSAVMGQAGRRIFEEHFTQQKMLNRIDALYQELIK